MFHLNRGGGGLPDHGGGVRAEPGGVGLQHQQGGVQGVDLDIGRVTCINVYQATTRVSCYHTRVSRDTCSVQCYHGPVAGPGPAVQHHGVQAAAQRPHPGRGLHRALAQRARRGGQQDGVDTWTPGVNRNTR